MAPENISFGRSYAETQFKAALLDAKTRLILIRGDTGTGKSTFVKKFLEFNEGELNARRLFFERFNASLFDDRAAFLKEFTGRLRYHALPRKQIPTQPAPADSDSRQNHDYPAAATDTAAPPVTQKAEPREPRIVLLFEDVAYSPFLVDLLFYVKDLLSTSTNHLLPVLIADEKLLITTLESSARGQAALVCYKTLLNQSYSLSVNVSPRAPQQSYCAEFLRELIESAQPDPQFYSLYGRDLLSQKSLLPEEWAEASLSILRLYLREQYSVLCAGLLQKGPDLNLALLRKALETFLTLGRYFLICKQHDTVAREEILSRLNNLFYAILSTLLYRRSPHRSVRDDHLLSKVLTLQSQDYHDAEIAQHLSAFLSDFICLSQEGIQNLCLNGLNNLKAQLILRFVGKVEQYLGYGIFDFHLLTIRPAVRHSLYQTGIIPFALKTDVELPFLPQFDKD